MVIWKRAVSLWIAFTLIVTPGSAGAEFIGKAAITNGSALARMVAVGGAALFGAASGLRVAGAQTPPPPKTWGANGTGQLGNNSTTSSSTAVSVSTLGAVDALAGGWGHSLALLPDGTVASWGKNNDGQLGNNTTTESHTPVTVSGLSGIIAVAAGKNHSLALKNDGTVWAWGSNRYGQLGTTSSSTCTDFDSTSISCALVPVQIGSFIHVVSIAAGWDFSLVAKDDGSAWAWGDNASGQLGDGTTTQRSAPVQVVGPSGTGTLQRVIAVAGGRAHSVVLKVEGTVWTWGDNTYGQLGNSSTTSSSTPVQVAGVGGSGVLPNATGVAAGDSHSVAVRTDGQVVAWGKNNVGQLGTTSGGTCSSTSCAKWPLLISTFFRNAAVAAGGNHTLALKSDDGSIYGWGENNDGELGDGTTTNRSTPTQASGLSRMTTLAAGIDHSLAASTAPALEPPPLGTEHNPPYIHQGVSRGGVDTLTGSYSTSLLSAGGGAGLGPVPMLTVTVNSDDYRVSPLGPGWTHNYAAHVAVPGAGRGDVILVGPQGRSDRYTPDSGGYAPPPGVSTTLVRNSDGTYAATYLDQTVWHFDANGKLSSIVDRYGNESDLTYNSNGQLTSVSDPAGRGSLSLSYSSTTGRLTGVSDWLGSGARSTTFGYDSSNRLQTLTDRTSHATTFGYDGASPRVTTITDARSQTVLTNAYDQTTLRVSTQTDALSNQTSYSYPSSLDGTTPTVVTYPVTSADTGWHAKSEDTYTALGLPPSFLIRHIDKPASSSGTWATTTFTYDANGFTSTVTDPRNNATTFCFDRAYDGTSTATRGNLGRVIAPAVTDARSNSSVQPITLYQYDSYHNLTETIAPNGVASPSGSTCTTNLSSAIDSSFATDNTYDSTTHMKLLSTARHFTDPDLGSRTATTSYTYGDSAVPGRVTAVTSPNSDSTSLAYYHTGDTGGPVGLLKSVTGPAVPENGSGNRTTYFYDSMGRRTSMVDPLGNISGGTAGDHTWTWSYDAEDRVVSSKTPAPQFSQGTHPLETDYQYDTVGNRTVRIDSHPDTGSGQVTKYAYDERSQLHMVQQSANSWTDPGTTPSGLVNTLYSYDTLGNLVRVDRDGSGSSSTTAERVVDYAYDGSNRVTRERQYPSSTPCWPTAPNDSNSCTTPPLDTTFTYDANSNRGSLVDPLTQTTSFSYDVLNRLTGVSYSGAVTGTSSTSNVSYSYDLNGNRHAMVDSGTTTYAYDQLDRMTSVTGPGSVTVGYRYDLDGNRRKLIYPDGMSVTYTLDAADRLQSLSDSATSNSTSYTYQPDSRLGGVSNFNGTSTAYTWDNARRLLDILHQDGTSTLSHHGFTLDSLGNRTHFDEDLPVLSGESGEFGGGLVAGRVAGAGASATDNATLDELVAATTDLAQQGQQPTRPAQPGAIPPRASKELSLQDTSSRPERQALFHAEPTGHSLDLFDKKSPTASVEVQNQGSRSSLRFELPGVATNRVALGSKASAQVGDLNVTWTSFDDHLKEDIVLNTQPSSNTISFNVAMKGLGFAKDAKGGWMLMDVGGHPHFYLPTPTVKDANGKSGSATLDLKVDTAMLTIDRTFLATAAYPVTIDPTINYVLATVGTSFTYDQYGPVSQLVQAAAEQDGFAQSNYQFDAVRNRTQLVQGATQPTDQRLTSDYTYDRADRLTSVASTPAGTGSTTTTFSYTWDANGNLKARSGGSVSDSFSYDQANRLTSANTSAGSGTYTYDGDGKRTSKTVSSTTTNYVWDVAGGLPRLLSDGTHKFVWGANGLAYNLTFGSSPATETYHADQIGSIREITSGDGSVHTTYLTDEYGNRTTVQGTDDQPFQYTGEQVDPETGFVFLRARYYDPFVGRFLSRDPAPGLPLAPETLNGYAYTANNPINYLDPSGLDVLGTRAHQIIEAAFLVHPSRPAGLWFPEQYYPGPSGERYFVDLVDVTSGNFYEIKPWTERAAGVLQVNDRVNTLGLTPEPAPFPEMWIDTNAFLPGTVLHAWQDPDVQGLVLYEWTLKRPPAILPFPFPSCDWGPVKLPKLFPNCAPPRLKPAGALGYDSPYDGLWDADRP